MVLSNGHSYKKTCKSFFYYNHLLFILTSLKNLSLVNEFVQRITNKSSNSLCVTTLRLLFTSNRLLKGSFGKWSSVTASYRTWPTTTKRGYMISSMTLTTTVATTNTSLTKRYQRVTRPTSPSSATPKLGTRFVTSSCSTLIIEVVDHRNVKVLKF